MTVVLILIASCCRFSRSLRSDLTRSLNLHDLKNELGSIYNVLRTGFCCLIPEQWTFISYTSPIIPWHALRPWPRVCENSSWTHDEFMTNQTNWFRVIWFCHGALALRCTYLSRVSSSSSRVCSSLDLTIWRWDTLSSAACSSSLARLLTSCDAMMSWWCDCHVIVMWCDVIEMWCDWDVMSCHSDVIVMWCDVMWCDVMWCYVMSLWCHCDVMSL